jgi:hypothetical protein
MGLMVDDMLTAVRTLHYPQYASAIADIAVCGLAVCGVDIQGSIFCGSPEELAIADIAVCGLAVCGVTRDCIVGLHKRNIPAVDWDTVTIIQPDGDMDVENIGIDRPRMDIICRGRSQAVQRQRMETIADLLPQAFPVSINGTHYYEVYPTGSLAYTDRTKKGPVMYTVGQSFEVRCSIDTA